MNEAQSTSRKAEGANCVKPSARIVSHTKRWEQGEFDLLSILHSFWGENRSSGAGGAAIGALALLLQQEAGFTANAPSEKIRQDFQTSQHLKIDIPTWRMAEKLMRDVRKHVLFQIFPLSRGSCAVIPKGKMP